MFWYTIAEIKIVIECFKKCVLSFVVGNDDDGLIYQSNFVVHFKIFFNHLVSFYDL